MIATRSFQQGTPEPTVERMVIHPDQALRWLETANTNNRKAKHPYTLPAPRVKKQQGNRE